jgi:hypothetical protein
MLPILLNADERMNASGLFAGRRRCRTAMLVVPLRSRTAVLACTLANNNISWHHKMNGIIFKCRQHQDSSGMVDDQEVAEAPQRKPGPSQARAEDAPSGTPRDK